MICQNCIDIINQDYLPKEPVYCTNQCIMYSYSNIEITTAHLTKSLYVVKLFTNNPNITRIIFSTKPQLNSPSVLVFETKDLIHSIKSFAQKIEYLNLLE